jgi:hypothetical protein
MTKLLENIYLRVNIALVNEFKLLCVESDACRRHGIRAEYLTPFEGVASIDCTIAPVSKKILSESRMQ